MTDPRIKVDFFRRKSATKFLCLKTVSSKVVRHSLAYLTMNKWFVGNVPLNVNIVHKVNHPLAVHINAFRKGDAYTICIAMITLQYEIYNNAN